MSDVMLVEPRPAYEGWVAGVRGEAVENCPYDGPRKVEWLRWYDYGVGVANRRAQLGLPPWPV